MSSRAGAYDGLMWGCDRVGLEMMKNGQTVKGQGKESGFYPGYPDGPVWVFKKLTLLRCNLYTIKL